MSLRVCRLLGPNSIFLNSVQFAKVNQIINEIKSQHYARLEKLGRFSCFNSTSLAHACREKILCGKCVGFKCHAFVGFREWNCKCVYLSALSLSLPLRFCSTNACSHRSDWHFYLPTMNSFETMSRAYHPEQLEIIYGIVETNNPSAKPSTHTQTVSQRMRKTRHSFD